MRSDLCPDSFAVTAGRRGTGGNGRFTDFEPVACVLHCDCRTWLLTLQQRQPSRSASSLIGPPHIPMLLALLLLLLQLLKVAQPLRRDIVLSLAPSTLPSAVEGCSHKQARSTDSPKDEQGNHFSHHLACMSFTMKSTISLIPIESVEQHKRART